MEVSSLGRYQLRGELGRGTGGVVYRGYDPVIDRLVALKTVVLPDSFSSGQRQAFLERFFLEARIAGKLIHPHIVVTYDAAHDERTGIPFMVMELVEGDSLAKRLEKSGRLPWKVALDLAIPLAEALDYAHHQGVVHRDIKPANVLLTRHGTPKIADFGIAKLPSAQLTQSGVVMGTPLFMSPEQLRGERIDGRSDLFSLGALLYNLVTGQPPFTGSQLAAISHQVLYKHPAPPSEQLPDIPESLDSVILRALAKPPGDRYSSGAELAEDLAAVKTGTRPRQALSWSERGAQTQPLRAVRPPRPEEKHQGTTSSRLLGTLEGLGAPQRRWPWLLLVGLLGTLVLYLSGVKVDPWVQRTGHLWKVLTQLSEQVTREISRLKEANRERRARQEQIQALQSRAEALRQRGQFLTRRGQWLEARRIIDESLNLSQEAKDGGGEAAALLWRGQLAAEQGKWFQARADLEAAAAVYRIYDRPAGQSQALVLLGNLERDRGRDARAEELYRQA
ncbi:MAG: protein kinase, partial [Acidobacteriota bacterium]